MAVQLGCQHVALMPETSDRPCHRAVHAAAVSGAGKGKAWTRPEGVSGAEGRQGALGSTPGRAGAALSCVERCPELSATVSVQGALGMWSRP